jgi:N-acetylglucosamine kinase-like BadF-type ATPase
VVERDGEPAGTFEGDAANVRRAGVENAAATISRAVGSATQGRGADAVVVGAAGAGDDDLAAALQAALEQHLQGASVRVVNDAMIALRAAVPQGDGIVVISGTGSIAYASIGERTYRAGGHGFLVGDEGSGTAIGAAAVRLLLRSYDGRGYRDGFTEALESLLDVESADDVVQVIYGDADPVRKLASLAPMVLACASDGERSPSKIAQAAAMDLAELLKAVVHAADVATLELPVVFAGGVLSENSLLTYLLETRVANEYPHFVPIKNPPAPEYGALALARLLAH